MDVRKLTQFKKNTADWDIWQSSLAQFKTDLRKGYSQEITGLLPD
jgi:hypothetical protein